MIIDPAIPGLIDVECDRVTSARLYWLTRHLAIHGFSLSSVDVSEYSKTVMRVRVNQGDTDAVFAVLKSLEGLAIPIPAYGS